MPSQYYIAGFRFLSVTLLSQINICSFVHGGDSINSLGLILPFKNHIRRGAVLFHQPTLASGYHIIRYKRCFTAIGFGLLFIGIAGVYRANEKPFS
ncbi:MAG: hypothetical protein CM1200mP3_05760 [Chloroflexota bacterium]|nr:MAG: hypothetical protein CM1200mP3_05760 [Chloroflexota bacterium]